MWGIYFTKVTVEIGVKIPTSGHPLGLIIYGDDFVMKVKSITTKRFFFMTQLTSGMYIDKINGKKYYLYDEGMGLLRGATGRITIVASSPSCSSLTGGGAPQCTHIPRQYQSARRLR